MHAPELQLARKQGFVDVVQAIGYLLPELVCLLFFMMPETRALHRLFLDSWNRFLANLKVIV